MSGEMKIVYFIAAPSMLSRMISVELIMNQQQYYARRVSFHFIRFAALEVKFEYFEEE